jgi:hypothetical protein
MAGGKRSLGASGRLEGKSAKNLRMADRAEPENLQGPAANAAAPSEPLLVFISYASPDTTVAVALVDALERQEGIAVIPVFVVYASIV